MNYTQHEFPTIAPSQPSFKGFLCPIQGKSRSYDWTQGA
jgi:hypothetical protein